MKYILGNRIREGDAFNTLLTVIHSFGYSLGEDDYLVLCDLYTTNTFPERYYKRGILSLDEIADNVEEVIELALTI